jgi:hypothetical protein
MNVVLSRLRLRHSVFFVLAVVSVLTIALLVLISSVSASTDVTRTSYITRLNNPRGLMINAEGNLVIAEQGTGADDGRLLEAIDLNDDGDANDKGELKKIAEGLPSFLSGDPEDPNLAGVSGVAQADDGTYWLVVGGGLATGGLPRPPFSTLGRIVDGAYEVVADLGQYEADHDPDEDGPDSNPYDLTFGTDGFIYLSDAGANAVLRVNPETGDITTHFVLPSVPNPLFSQGTGGPTMDPVPTGLAFGLDSALYVSFLTGFPFPQGAAFFVRLADLNGDSDAMDSGEALLVSGGLSALTDITFGPDGAPYLVEFSTNFLGENVPGRLVQYSPRGNMEIAAGLVTPTALVFSENNFFISEESAGIVSHVRGRME